MYQSLDTGAGYKIVIYKDKAMFELQDEQGNLIEYYNSIADLEQDKKITKDKVAELRELCESTYSEELKEINAVIYSIRNKMDFFSKYFKDTTFSMKLGKNTPKGVYKTIVDKVKQIVASEINEHVPVSVADGKIEVIFRISPISTLRTFEDLYDKIIKHGNFSVVSQALDFIRDIEQLYMITNDIITYIETDYQ